MICVLKDVGKGKGKDKELNLSAVVKSIVAAGHGYSNGGIPGAAAGALLVMLT